MGELLLRIVSDSFPSITEFLCKTFSQKMSNKKESSSLKKTKSNLMPFLVFYLLVERLKRFAEVKNMFDTGHHRPTIQE